MDQQQEIEHSYLDINGLSLHVAYTGKGEKGTVVFLHGFPEIWYTWRHQMIGTAKAGYRAIAPDCRGYGLSGCPLDLENAKWTDLVADLLAILDSFSIPKAFIVGGDFGAISAYDFALHHPERVAGVVTLGVPYLPKGFALDSLPEGFYIWRWREPQRAEADFGRFDAKTVVRNVYILFSRSEIPIAAEGQEIMDLAGPSTPLPPWFTEEDLQVYGDLYEKSGFQFALRIPYRTLDKMVETANPKVELPALLIVGEEDYVFKFPGIEQSIKSGMLKEYVPDLEIKFLPEGTHFVQEQLPEEVNQLLVAFLDSHTINGA